MSFAGDIATDTFKMTWQDTHLFETLERSNEDVNKKIMAVMEYKAPDVEAYMKVNAPWNDQTGNARQGLAAQAFQEGDNFGIVLFGQVPYQIWLETKFSGRDAIIEPTIQVKGPEVMASLENILGSVRF